VPYVLDQLWGYRRGMTMAKPRPSGVDRVKFRHAVDSGIAMVALALTGLLAGAVAWVFGWQSAADLAWAITTAIAVPPVAISLLQALTQIQEMTLVFVPKILAIFAAMLIALPFMADLLQSHMLRIAARIAAE